MQTSLTALGYVIDKNGIHTSNDKIEAMMESKLLDLNLTKTSFLVMGSTKSTKKTTY